MRKVRIGRFNTGKENLITDVKGIKVGHITRIENEPVKVRTGVTAIIPSKDIYLRRMIAGGFVLNGVGEMSGLTQIMEWGLLETPILLTNSLSVGNVHTGVVNFMQEKYPELGQSNDVVLPVVGETDDSFLNDLREGINTSSHAVKAIKKAKKGCFEQGSVGAGTGMITCDFAGGIGSSSRIIEISDEIFTIGVLVLSNFGKMRNLTMDGMVIGRKLDKLFPKIRRREQNYGSIIVVVATDAPMTSGQLSRVSKRAALGIGRAGSYAGYTSGEIIISFSTANRILREGRKRSIYQNMRFINDKHIDPFYEGVIEATEESILNAILFSSGMDGRDNRFSPAIPQDFVSKVSALI